MKKAMFSKYWVLKKQIPTKAMTKPMLLILSCLGAALFPWMAEESRAEGAVETVSLDLTAGSPAREIRLDGLWWFRPEQQAAAAEALDAEAVRLSAIPEDGASWYPLAVPQFLNRYSWWLDISRKFVAQDQARLDALPFDASQTRAGWYKRVLHLPAGTGETPEVLVRFEGVAMISRVYCNGRQVGGHVGMFGAFECRLTPHLKRGEPNTLLVYAERGADVDDADEVLGVAVTVAVTRGMLASLNHGMFGGFGRGALARFLGIWQPVTLKISQPGARLADAFFRPALDGHAIDVTLRNSGEDRASGRLHYSVRDVRSGELLHEEALGAVHEIAPNDETTVTFKKRGLRPKPWTPDFPNLYELTIEWRSPDGGRLLDRWTHKVGYRTVEVSGGLLHLNGKPYWARGAGMPVYGYKPNDAITARAFLRRMHEAHQMVTRSGCNPWNSLWFGLADEEGVGVVAEGVRPWALMGKTPPPDKALIEHWKQEQIQTVLRYRNHPSILFYCISNEGLQGDHENPEKLAIFKDIMDAVRAADPTRPVCQTSGEPDVTGRADIEDVHSYWGWYEPSSYVTDYDQPRRGLGAGKGRAFINKETAVPYQDTDTGGVHSTYVRLYSAHPWVGELGAEGEDPSFFAEHIRAETQLKTEKLRRQRAKQPTAGMILFANTTWIGDVLTQNPERWKPFPVWESARQALAPVLVGWTTPQSVFHGGETVTSRVFVVNDDARFRDLRGLELRADVHDAEGRSLAGTSMSLGNVPYFESREWPFSLRLPEPPQSGADMIRASVRLTLRDSTGVVGENSYPIRIASRRWSAAGGSGLVVACEGCGHAMRAHLEAMDARVLSLAETVAGQHQADVVLLGPGAVGVKEAEVRAALKEGGRLVVLGQGADARRFCPDVFPSLALVWQPARGYTTEPRGLRSGARWTGDRDITLTDIPARLRDATWISTRMADKESDPSHPLLRFRLQRGGHVLVAYDSRARALPEWLREWKKTGETIGTSIGLPLDVFEKRFPSGEVVLGGNRAKGVSAMYGVAVLPDEDSAVEQLEVAELTASPVGKDNDLDHFMFEKAADSAAGTRTMEGEFVEILGWREREPLFDGLEAMDWKWWARGEGRPFIACTAAHRIDAGRKDVVPLGRHLDPHFYWSGDLKQVYAAKLAWPVFAVRRSWGTLIVCELAIPEALPHDPRAARTLSNLVSRPLEKPDGD